MSSYFQISIAFKSKISCDPKCISSGPKQVPGPQVGKHCSNTVNKKNSPLQIHPCFVCFAVPDIFEDGLPHPAQAYVKVCSSLSEASLDEETGAKTPPPKHPSLDHQGPVLPPAGTTVQRRSVLHTEEIVRCFSPKSCYYLVVYLSLLSEVNHVICLYINHE